MRHWIHSDTDTSVAAATEAQVLAFSQPFPLTPARLRSLYASATLLSPDGITFISPGGSRGTSPFIGWAFRDAAGNLLDYCFFVLEHIGPSQLWLTNAGAGYKWAQTADLSEAIFVSGRGGYPTGAVTVSLVAGLEVRNNDGALAHIITVALRAIVAEEED
jgi:hypothetical protein